MGGKEAIEFIAAEPGKTLQERQIEALTALLHIDKRSYLGDRGRKIDVPGFPEMEVTGGNDGFKLIVKAPALGMFAKVYWTQAHAAFVMDASITINQILPQHSLDTQSIIGQLGRALVFAYRSDIVNEMPKVPLSLATDFIKVIQDGLIGMNRPDLVGAVAYPSMLLLSNGSVLASDVIVDGYRELIPYAGT